ncbi:MAG: hypothetical protein QN183_12900 [Armatimonadota bacterium]|nr:hypothetical protein [Armatimonadota bacterium]MDR7486304.1 hypothetical protein [Armatimonadota bacterium]MDR7532279.1 hypothetical protein [Armatimonadota bacterium]MDR7537248.1 hypothetical protein [Armatimonadota bacterium]
MRSAPPWSALVAVVLSAAALALAVLSASSASRPPAGPPATVDLTLLITATGGPTPQATHHAYNPQMIVARRGDLLRLRVMNLSLFTHGLVFEGLDARTQALYGGAEEAVSVVAGKGGVFPYRCYIPYDPVARSCSPDHETMVGYLVVLDDGR